jgi:hypothetical protein
MRIWRLLLLAVFLALGCGGSRTASVTGKITLDGKPLKNGRVNFQPTGDTVNTGVGSFGRTDANGVYTLTLIDESTAGAIIGKHRVTISAFDKEPDPNDDRQRGPQDRVPRKYNIASELTFDVKPGANTANFDLTTSQ